MNKILRLIVLILIGFTLFGCSDASVNISFETNGSIEIEDVILEKGVVFEPVIPSRIGYVFEGWYLDVELTQPFDKDIPLDKHITLYAKWKAETEIIFELLALDISSITLDQHPITDAYLDLPLTGPNGSQITWTYDNLDLMNAYGIIFHPIKGEADAIINLTGLFEIGTFFQSHTWQLTIPAITDVLIESKIMIPFTNLTSEYDVKDDMLTTYYAENRALPYVDVYEFLMILNGLIESAELEFNYFGHIIYINYFYEEEIKDAFDQVIETKKHEYVLKIDFLDNTISTQSLSFFDGYILRTATNYSDGISYLDTYVEAGFEVVFELDPYRFDLIMYENEGIIHYLLPFHIANLLFTSGSYYNVYYNGDAYYGIYAFPDKNDQALETEDGIAYQTIKNSSKNQKEIDPDIIVATYDYLAFTLDYLYGLKIDKNITSFHDVLRPYRDQMATGKTSDLSQTIFDFIYKNLDDLHSSHHFPGYYEAPTKRINLTSINQLGPNVQTWYQSLWAMQDLHHSVYYFRDKVPPDYRMLDDETAVIYLDGFYTATIENPMGKDSDRFMKQTLETLFDLYPNVKNIVVDISYNTGGNLGALLRVLGYMTEAPIEMSYMNPTDGSKMTYFIEVDRIAYTNVNWYFMTSPVTFSAANLMASIGKDMGFATLIGQKTGGGASSILPIVLPDGTLIHISSLNVLSQRILDGTDYQYQSIENGITPDVFLNLSDTQNKSKILDAIRRSQTD